MNAFDIGYNYGETFYNQGKQIEDIDAFVADSDNIMEALYNGNAIKGHHDVQDFIDGMYEGYEEAKVDEEIYAGNGNGICTED